MLSDKAEEIWQDSSSDNITGGGFFHSKRTCGNVPLRTSSLAKGMLLVDFSLGKGMLFGSFWLKKCQSSVIPVKKPDFFGSRECETLASLSRKRQLMALLM